MPPSPSRPPGSPAPVSAPRAPRTLKDLLRQHERLIIVKTLAQNAFSRRSSADALGITVAQLRRRVISLGIDVSQFPRDDVPRKPKKKFPDLSR